MKSVIEWKDHEGGSHAFDVETNLIGYQELYALLRQVPKRFEIKINTNFL